MPRCCYQSEEMNRPIMLERIDADNLRVQIPIEWMEIATVLDSLLLRLFMILFLVVLIVLLSMVQVAKPSETWRVSDHTNRYFYSWFPTIFIQLFCTPLMILFFPSFMPYYWLSSMVTCRRRMSLSYWICTSCSVYIIQNQFLLSIGTKCDSAWLLLQKHRVTFRAYGDQRIPIHSLIIFEYIWYFIRMFAGMIFDCFD